MDAETNKYNLDNETFQNAVQVIEQILDFNNWSFVKFDLKVYPQTLPQILIKMSLFGMVKDVIVGIL